MIHFYPFKPNLQNLILRPDIFLCSSSSIQLIVMKWTNSRHTDPYNSHSLVASDAEVSPQDGGVPRVGVGVVGAADGEAGVVWGQLNEIVEQRAAIRN